MKYSKAYPLNLIYIAKMLIWSLIGNNNQDYEPLEKIVNNDLYYGLPK